MVFAFLRVLMSSGVRTLDLLACFALRVVRGFALQRLQALWVGPHLGYLTEIVELTRDVTQSASAHFPLTPYPCFGISRITSIAFAFSEVPNALQVSRLDSCPMR